MYKKIIVSIIVIIIVILISIFIFKIFSSPKTEDSNILVFTRDSIGTKDLKLIGYFSNNLLEKYEISYYIEYENETFARDAYNRLMESIQKRDDIKYTYSIDNNCVYVKLDYIIEYMDISTLQSLFETSDSSINKKQFENYAEGQGYIRQ